MDYFHFEKQAWPTKTAVSEACSYMLGLVPCVHEMETMENGFSCIQERPGNETRYA